MSTPTRRSRREAVLALLSAGNPGTPLAQRVCEVSGVLLGVSGAGMCLVGARSHQVLVHGTTGLAEELEDLQLELGQGPCLLASRTGSPTLVPDLNLHRTAAWPLFAEQALSRGVRALFSFPLRSGDSVLGALDLYRDTPGPLTGSEMADALTLSDIAAEAMVHQRDLAHLDGSIGALPRGGPGHRSTGEPVSTVAPDEDTVARAGAVDGGVATHGASVPLRLAGVDDLPEAHPGGVVLVVVDEAGMRLVLGRALSRLGYRVFLADTVADGIIQLYSQPGLAAVIADITMPTSTGLDFAAAVIARHASVPILFLTGGPTASGALDDPLIGLVAKPFRLSDLRLQLAALIDRADRMSAARSDASTQPPVADDWVIGNRGRRFEPGGAPTALPEVDRTTATWAAIAGAAGLPKPLHHSESRAPSAVPGVADSTRLARLGLFAAGVANDVNNMLAVVSMRAELLTEGDGSHSPIPAIAEDVVAIAAATARASGLVQQLMLFAGQRTLDRGPVDVAELVESMAARLDEVAGAPGVIVCAVDPVPGISGDHEHLEQVVLNLVRNALEATAGPTDTGAAPGTAQESEPKLARVRIRVAPTEELAGPQPFRQFPDRAAEHTAAGVLLEVADSGSGMSAEVRERALEPFFRAYTSVGGTGLGLSIVYGIVTQHGGQLDIDSAPALGTTVRITFPAAALGAAGDQRTAA